MLTTGPITMQKKLSFKEVFSREGVVLAAIPIVAYYSGYQYNVGYFKVFGAPLDLISVDLTTFVVFGSYLLALSYIIYNTIYILLSAITNLSIGTSWKKFVSVSISVFIILWLLFWLLYEDWRTASTISGTLLTLIVFFNLPVLKKA